MNQSDTYVVGNWKMNLGPKAGHDLLQELKAHASNSTSTAVWVAPPATSISSAVQATAGTAVAVGAQNVHWESQGAFTGELSAPMLAESGCSFAIVGHSERRHIFGETDQLITKRALGALANSAISIIFCIGETLEQRESGQTTELLRTQLEQLFQELSPADYSRTIIAYEPVWAIGTGRVAGLTEIQQAHADIISFWGEKVTSTGCPPILYGGSVNPDNFTEIISIPEVAGALVGGASLSVEKFGELIAIAAEASK